MINDFEAWEELIRKHFLVSPKLMLDWTSTSDILSALQEGEELRRWNVRAISMKLSRWLPHMGAKRVKRRNSQGRPVWGYYGVRHI